MAGRVLIVEDEALLAQGIAFNLRHEGFEVEHAPTGEEGLRRLAAAPPVDLVLLDVMLPGLDGFAVLERLRAGGRALPVILLTARATDVDVVRGLELGADDYVPKPFSVAQLVARIRAVLRRAGGAAGAGADATPVGAGAPGAGPAPERFRCPGVEVDLDRRLARRDGREHPLTTTEAELLRLLRAAPGHTLDRLEVMRKLWGPFADAGSRTVDNHVARLRRKLERDPSAPRALLTVHGKGYRLVLEPP